MPVIQLTASPGAPSLLQRAALGLLHTTLSRNPLFKKILTETRLAVQQKSTLWGSSEFLILVAPVVSFSHLPLLFFLLFISRVAMQVSHTKVYWDFGGG